MLDRLLPYGVWILCAAACFGETLPAQPYAQDHVVVKFRSDQLPGPSARRAAGFVRTLLDEVELPAGAVLEETGFARWKREQRPVRSDPGIDFSRHLLLRLPPDMTPEACVEALRKDPLVEYALLDYIGTGGAVFPDDPSFGVQWHLHNSPSRADIHAPEAWEITMGSSNVILALLDTGLNTTLSEFSGRVVPGYDFVNSDTDPADDHGHGTTVAGSAFANTSNGVLVAGVDWHCKLMPVKVLNAENQGYYSDWADGIDFAVANGAKVINLSAGGSTDWVVLEDAILNAISSGVLFVTIAHNDGSGTVRFPGRFAPCITVGATDANDVRASFSNYGSAIDLVAPGTNITTVTRFGTQSSVWGTSFAGPIVAGVCTLLAALDPAITQEQARTLLCAGAEDQVGDGVDTPGFDIYYGWGRLNAWYTLQLAATYLDHATFDAGEVSIAWDSPMNASNKAPYEVFSTGPLPAFPWTVVSQSNEFTYTPTTTTWTASQTNGAVRGFGVRVRAE